MLQTFLSNKFWYFKLDIYQVIMHKMYHGFYKTANIVNIDNKKKCFSSIKSVHVTLKTGV